jgi:hypothetical protein
MTVASEKRNNSRMAERIAALAGTSAPPISPIPHPQTMTTLHRQETPLPRPQYVISEDTAAITWIKPRAKRDVFIGQGRNRILLSRTELAKLIAVVLELDPAQEPKGPPGLLDRHPRKGQTCPILSREEPTARPST